MDEDTTNFYHNNLNIVPEGITFALNYVNCILTILSRHNDQCKGLKKSLKKLKLMDDKQFDESKPYPVEIAKKFESSTSTF